MRNTRLTVILGALLTLVALCAPAGAQPNVFPDIDVFLVAEVDDIPAWLALHQEALSTPTDSAKILRATVPAPTGGNRSLDVEHPKFTVSVVGALARPAVKVTVSGKVNASLALAAVTPFEQAALAVQAGVVRNELSLAYGLSGVVGQLLELHIGRP
jgi:hypothetical protein